MRIALSSPVRTRAFLCVCAGLISVCFALSLQAIVEHHLLAHPTVHNIKLAQRVQPLNADDERMIGQSALESGRYQVAVVHLRRSVQMNPHASRVWLMLADAYEMMADDNQRDDAVRRATAAEPKDTQVEWRAANLSLNTDLDRSLQLLRGVVENDPRYSASAMEVAYRASGANVDKAMLAIPLETKPRLEFMRWLVDRKHYDDADHVWPTLLRAPSQLRPRDVFFYFDSLLDRHHPNRAHAAWLALAQREPSMRAQVQPGNEVFNGDFEGDLLSGGFGWRYVPTEGVTASLDTSTFHSGTRSLALQIDGENVQDFGFRQFVKVEPGARYRLSAWMHAEELQAAFGVRVAIFDAYSHAELFLSDEALGSFPWRQLDTTFTVPPDTELVTVSLVRSPSQGRIRGTLWLDDLRIEKR